MAPEKDLNHFSVFLVKHPHEAVDQIVNVASCEPPIDVRVTGLDVGQLFIKRMPAKPPRWAKLFREHLDVKSLKVPSIAAAFVARTAGRWFVLTFGQGGRFLLRDDVHEDRFGLLCALNAVDQNTFRCVDVQSLDAIQSHKRIQAGQATTADQFGLDVEQDMLKAIVGTPLNPGLGSRMTGSDALSVEVRADLSDLPHLLNEYRKKSEEDLSATEHQWVNNISLVRSAALIGDLEATLDAKLSAGDYEDAWLSIPEIIDWSSVVGFIFSGSHGAIRPDITMQGFLAAIEPPVTLDLMRSRRVFCADTDHNCVFKSWPVLKCLYAEVDHQGGKYILNDGRWFRVAKDFVSRTDDAYSRLPLSKLTLPPYKGGGEGAYNESVAVADPKRYVLLDDKKKIAHGGGHGQVEVCDLLTIDRELVHVKLYGKSSVFSHLFSQGFVSGQLIRTDSTFREKVRKQLAGPFADMFSGEGRPTDFTIVYAIISEAPEGRPRLPFFSRVNLNNTARLLKGFGYGVELLKIPVLEEYAKTVKLRPSRKARPRN
ncbi:MAG TPA: DUF6119 family protein [bacterium]|nr:DUF6119 family protein [bacterium]